VQKHANYGEHNHAIKRAAGFITSFLDYKQMIDSGTLPAEGGKEPPCMYQYTRMFGITRIPIQNEDVLVTHQDSKHIIVMIQDQIYAVDVFDQTGDRVSLSKIEE
jgi:carnitine O-acetyltransferase